MARPQVSLVLSGGAALGAYQGGAYAALHQHEELRPQRIAGSSIGAVNAALIAGNRLDRRIERLRRFWDTARIQPIVFETPWIQARMEGPWRHAYSWLGVFQTRLFGRPGLFQPRLPELMLKNVTSIYDLAPLGAKLKDLVDFERLNDGAVRVSIVTTDVETGQEIVFDTHRGDRIGPEHLLASCGFLPDFAPVQIDGRLLGDGGFVANAPVGTVLQDPELEDELLCFVVDLFSPEGGRPSTLEEAAARRWDLILGNQSREKLDSLEREYRLRWALGRLAPHLRPDARMDPELTSVLLEGVRHRTTLLHLSYCAPVHEAGPEKAFDFSRTTLADRWESGFLDMVEAVGIASDMTEPRNGFSIHRIHRHAHGR
jgi:NTE family protein